jgi:hypothetical protein
LLDLGVDGRSADHQLSRSRSRSPSYPMGNGLKQQELEADHSPASSPEDDNAWGGGYKRMYPKVSGLAAWSEICK